MLWNLKISHQNAGLSIWLEKASHARLEIRLKFSFEFGLCLLVDYLYWSLAISLLENLQDVHFTNVYNGLIVV